MMAILVFIVVGFLLSGCHSCIGPMPSVAPEDIPGTYILQERGIKQTLVLKSGGIAESYRVLSTGEEFGPEKGHWSVLQTDRTWIQITNFCLWKYSDYCRSMEAKLNTPSLINKYNEVNCHGVDPNCPSATMEMFWFRNKIMISVDIDGGFDFYKSD